MADEIRLLETPANQRIEMQEIQMYSEFLERNVLVDMYSPNEIDAQKKYDVLLINDGQDLRTMNFISILEVLITAGSIEPMVCVSIHAGPERLNEYGTAYRPDYGGRGAKAGLYTKFILNELLAYLTSHYSITYNNKSFAGFSLGGLSALDIAWNNAAEFSKVGVFSGALWWRRHGYEDEKYNAEKDRIMHLQVQKGKLASGLQFFFECGQLDEMADRNNNGIIDSIEDTTDLINDLKNLGYTSEQIEYLELQDGEHNVETWKKAFPIFLKWGWPKKS